MINKDFIFSNKLSTRIKRHLVFWGFWWVYYAATHAAQPFNQEFAFFKNLPYALCESVLLFGQHFFLVYYMLYFVCPHFLLKNKYWAAAAFAIPGVAISVFVNWFLITNVNQHVLTFVLPPEFLHRTGRPPEVNFYMGLVNATKGTTSIAAMAVAIKFMKHWYLKEQRNAQLQKENAQAQLQLLTAQVHPHFLFNTLNNIYSQTQTESPRGSKMIMELSDLLRYILTEGNKLLVPLRKELGMIKNYMDLEKIRYGNKLDLHVSLPDRTGDLQIAPLLLLPFVENCFKHGASKFLKAPWVNLKIEVVDGSLIMKVMNGKDVHHSKNLIKSGTGINNVKKRLDLLYPGRYELDITDEPEVYVVNLKVVLTEKTEEAPTAENTLLQPAYA